MYSQAETAGLYAFLAGYSFFVLAIVIVGIIAWWKLFSKAGIAGWKCLIPVYNMYCICKMSWGNGWMFLTFFIPIVNFIFILLTLVKLAHAFGKGVGYILGLLFLTPIFILMLAFGDAEYQGVSS